MAENQSAHQVEEKQIFKIAMTSLAGTSIEWYDFFLYGTMAALVFPTLFFSETLPPLVGLMASFSTFAVGFIARPVGGILFGHFGDRIGRKKALVYALVLMGAATTLIGVLPTYGTIGWLAPLLLILCRFAQGLAIGGQWGGAVLLITETAPKEKRGFYGSFAQVGAPAGVILANLIVLVVTGGMSDDAFMAWGWRIPFIISIVLIFLAMYVELRVQDTAAFRELKALKEEQDREAIRHRAEARGESLAEAEQEIIEERTPSPVMEALKAYPKTIALAAGAFISIQVTFYILFAFVIAYGTNEATLGLDRSMMLTAVLIAAAIMIPLLLISAAYSDRKGRKGVYISGAVLMGIWGFALFPLIDTGSFFWITVATTFGFGFVAMQYGPQAAFLSELFTTKMRYSGASMGYQIGAIVGGAFAPIIATAILAETGSTVGVSIYIALASVVTVASVLMLQETYDTDLVDAESEVSDIPESESHGL